MPASVPTGAGELLPPAPGPFCPTRRPQQPAWALSTSRPPPALQPPLGLSSVADSSLPQAFARAIPAAWDTVPCPCTTPHTCSPFRSPGKLLQCPHQMPAEQSFPALGARASGWCPGLFAQLSGSPSSPTRPGRQLLVGRNQSHLLAAAGPSTERTAPPRGPRAHAARARMLGTPVPATEAARGHFPQFVFVKEEKGMLSHITRVPPERALPPAPWGLGPPPHPCPLSSPRQLHAPHPQACPHNRGPRRRPAAVWSSPRPFLCRGLIRASSFLVRVRRNQRTRTGSEPQLGGQPTSDLLLAPTLAPPCLRFQGSGPGISRTRRPCHSVRPPAKACQ